MELQETERIRYDIEQLEKRNQSLESSVELANIARNISDFGCDPLTTYLHNQNFAALKKHNESVLYSIVSLRGSLRQIRTVVIPLMTDTIVS